MSVLYRNINIISIEGNIGSGKSTLLGNLKEKLADRDDVVFLKEPVDEWSAIKDENGVTMLEKFYEDQVKYSFPFQMMAYISRLKLLKETVDEWINQKNGKYLYIFTERSLFTDKMVFAKMLYDTGKMESIQYQIYLNWFDTFAKEYPVKRIIYVKADPIVCHNRIAIRHREGEDHIPLNYLDTCNVYHEQMLDINSPDCVCSEQLVLDGNIDIFKNNDELNHWLNKIQLLLPPSLKRNGKY